MNPEEWSDALRQLTGITGVLGALIISAAFAAALVSRVARCTAVMRAGVPSSVHLLAEQGAVLAVAGPAPLWLVAVARHDAELGRLRLLLRDFAGALR